MSTRQAPRRKVKHGARKSTVPTPAQEDTNNYPPMLQFAAPTQVDRRTQLLKREFEPSKYLIWNDLETLGLATELRQLLDGSGWTKFFAINEPCYKELTIEFLATFTFMTPLTWDTPNTISFRLNRERYRMSVNDFGVACGVQDHDDFSNVPHHYANEMIDWSNREGPSAVGTFWKTISHSSLYNPSKTKSTFIKSPVLRILHRLIAHTIQGRRDSTGVVGRRDLFLLHNITKKIPVHIGHILAHYFEGVIGNTDGPICGGSYVTHLARNLGILAQCPGLTVACPMLPFGLTNWVRMGVIKRRGNTYEF